MPLISQIIFFLLFHFISPSQKEICIDTITQSEDRETDDKQKEIKNERMEKKGDRRRWAQ